MTYKEYKNAGYSIIEYDDNILDWFDELEKQLKPFNLKIEYADEECDGFDPFKIVPK